MSSNKDELTRSNDIETEQEVNQYSLVVKLGYDILSDGHTSIPNLILDLYTELGLTHSELVFIIHLMQYKWGKKNPYPALTSIAAKMGVSRRNVQRYVSSLKQKQKPDSEESENIKYLVITERKSPEHGQMSSIYDLSNFLYAVVELAKKKGLIDTPQTDLSRGGMTNLSRGPQTNLSTEEYEISNNTNLKNTKYISKGQKPLKPKRGERGDNQETTYSHIEQRSIRNETNRNSNIETNQQRSHRDQPQSISQIMQGMVSNMQVPTTNVQQPLSQSKGNWKKAPLFIQAMISEWFGPELHDQAIHSSITRTNNLFQAFVKATREEYGEQATFEILEDVFREHMQSARAKAKRASIKTLTDKGWPNRMPYFLTCLEKSLKLPGSEPN